MTTWLPGSSSEVFTRSILMSGWCSSSVIFSTKNVAPQVIHLMSRATWRSSRMFDDKQSGQFISNIVLYR